MNIKNPHLLAKLEKSGLTDKESLVYTTLLELGGAYPSKIAEYSGLNRSTTYKILLNLSIRGIINEIENKNKLYYQIDKPEKLLKHTRTKLELAEDEIEHVKQVIPDLEGLFAAFSNKPKVLYFENAHGIISLYEDHLNVKKGYEMLAFANTAQFEHVFPEKFFEKYRRAKEKIGITTRGIIPDTEKDTTFVSRMYEGYKPEVIPVVKYLSAEEFPFKGEIVIYGKNKVSIVNLNREHLTGVIIEDETIHKMMRMIFELSWTSTKIRD